MEPWPWERLRKDLGPVELQRDNAAGRGGRQVKRDLDRRGLGWRQELQDSGRFRPACGALEFVDTGEQVVRGVWVAHRHEHFRWSLFDNRPDRHGIDWR